MYPIFIFDDIPNLAEGNAIFLSEKFERYIIFRIISSYFSYVVFAQLRLCIQNAASFFSTIFSPDNMPSLPYHIAHVFFSGPQKKMLWIYAGRIVAFMAYAIIFWNFTDAYFVRKSMSHDDAAASFPELAITIPTGRSCPKPTIDIALSLLNLAPKSIINFHFNRLSLLGIGLQYQEFF